MSEPDGTTGTTVVPPKKPRKPGGQRFLIAVIILLILLSIGLLSGLLLTLRVRTPDVCLSPSCIHTAAVILSSMNSSVDPCVDFYEYACGNWIKQHPIPDDAPSVSNFENLGQDLELALKELLEEKPISGIDGDAVQKAKQFYHLCLNESQISHSWRGVFDDVLKHFGGWPSLMPPGSSVNVSIEKLYGMMVSKFRVDSLFKATVQPDDKNSEKHILLVDQPTLNLFARDFYMLAETEDERLAYRTLVRDVLVLLNASPQVALQDSEEILKFETQLANITVAEDQRHDIAELYSKWTIGQMREKFPHFDWLTFFNTIFEDIEDKNGNVITFNDSAEVVIYGVDFVERLDALMPIFDNKVIINYLNWCWFFKAMLRDLPDPFALTMFKFYRSLNRRGDDHTDHGSIRRTPGGRRLADA
uniref:Peptidase M13 N-terminal domain-containing protein n=1 Tax=Panagrolaimus sp. JU765 TaxID=591449 RepID=A0AC34PXB3_9BILA